MPRHFWISASIAVLVAAFALFALALPRLVTLEDSVYRASREAGGAPEVVTYKVPPARGEMIRETLKTVLLAYKQDVQPLGEANLAAPDRLVVSAPARMQPSIRVAIAQLVDEDSNAPPVTESAAIELWVVAAGTDAGPVDARLEAVNIVLQEARERFGHRQFRLHDRMMARAAPNGETIQLHGQRGTANIRLNTHAAGALEALLEVRVAREPGQQGQSVPRFASSLLLPAGQWQLVGLLPAANVSAPELLLLVRQTPSAQAIVPEQ